MAPPQLRQVMTNSEQQSARVLGGEYQKASSLPDAPAKVLESGDARDLQITQLCLHHLQLPGPHASASHEL